MINYDIESELIANLSPDEKFIWTGKPRTGILLRSSDIFLIPLSLLWAGFAVFWGSTAFVSGAPSSFGLFDIPIILVGLYITVGRFFVDAKKRANTAYGITADRIIIKTGVFSSEVKSLNIRTLSDITFSQKADNSGTITFGPTNFRYAMMQGMEWPGAKHPPRLELIDDVKSVYDKIIDLQRRK